VRENGYYWVQWAAGQWIIAEWEGDEKNGKGWMFFLDEWAGYPDECLSVIGPKIEPPSHPTP
jgi:hypothetical protein